MKQQILKTPHYYYYFSFCPLILFLWDIITKCFLSLSFFSKPQQKQSTCMMMMMRQEDEDDDDGVRLSREEVVMVMEELGLRVESNGEGLEGVIGEEEVEQVLEDDEEAEKLLGTLKSVFEVFDENGDGFIEGRELERVFKCLGIMERDVGECERMIGVFDENGDGMMDLNEFLNFMHNNNNNACIQH